MILEQKQELMRLKLPTQWAISDEHTTNNDAVRKTLLQRGIRPEQLPPAEDVKEIERRLSSEEKKSFKKPDALKTKGKAFIKVSSLKQHDDRLCRGLRSPWPKGGREDRGEVRI